MDLQDKIDNAYPRYYDYDVEISKKQWLELLQDREIFTEKNIEHMKCIYAFKNHAATCKEVSEILGDSAQAYNALGVTLAKRISKKLDIRDLPHRNGEGEGNVYWYILFYGQYVQDKNRIGTFEWKLKPELASALKELYPDLKYPIPIVEKKLGDVPISVWIATVLLTFISFRKIRKLEDTTIYHETTKIQETAQKICNKTVEYPRVYQWCTGDYNGDHTYCYLKAGEKALRRLTAPGEFGGKKERPGNLDLDMEFELDDTIVTVKTLIDFVEGEYSNLINSGKLTVIEKEFSLNSILYGPPGTGKTYNTILYAVAICDRKSFESLKKAPYEDVLKRYEELKKDGRIVFTTFHQSYGYEEFIEGIKPVINRQNDDCSSDIQYEYVSGVFKKFCEKAKSLKVHSSSLNIRENPTVWSVLLAGTGETELKKECFEKNYIKIGWADADKIVTEESENLNPKEKRILLNFQDEMQEGDIVFIQRSNTSIDAIGIVIGSCKYIESKRYPRTRSVQWIATGINEDVYILNKSVRLDRKTVYPLRNMDIKEVITLIEKYTSSNSVSVEENSNTYIFIIDEINRGNISKIFGELITLIEPTKRIGESEPTTTILPYTGDEFGVPNNVYILGTMNTADRSIALMDTALRRRFQFIEMMPDSSVLTKLGISEVEGINIVEMLETINERIEYLFDREHTIGHAYFTPLAKNPSLKHLASIFLNAILPLLQEYFYEDYSKIQLVLGDNSKTDNTYKFILDTEIKIKNVFKGNPDIDLPEKKYDIQTDAFYKAESYIQIY